MIPESKHRLHVVQSNELSTTHGVQGFQMPSESLKIALILVTVVLIFSCVAACRESKMYSHWTSALRVDSCATNISIQKKAQRGGFRVGQKGVGSSGPLQGSNARTGKDRPGRQIHARAHPSVHRGVSRKRHSPANHSERRCT